MKTIFICLLLATLTLASPKQLCNPVDDHDLTSGCKAAGKIDLRTTVEVAASFWQVRTKTLRYPEGGPGEKAITCIRVTDLVGNGRGGCPSIISGGADLKEVSLRFTSQKSRQMKFLVEIFIAA